jgi:type IV pilus assembly protein PilN
MIRINLIGSKTESGPRRAGGVGELIFFGVLFTLGLVPLYFVYSAVEQRNYRARTKISIERRHVKKLDRVIKQVAKFKRQKQLLKQQLKAIQKLQQNRKGPVRMLDEISTKIPRKVWIKTMQLKEQSIFLTGEANGNKVISSFIKRLQSSPFFENVTLNFAAQRDAGRAKKAARTAFSMSLKLAATN